MSTLHGLEDSARLTQAGIKPLQFDCLLAESYITSYHLAQQYMHCDWNTTWDACACFNQLSVWFPLLVHQVLIFMLETVVERPGTLSKSLLHPTYGLCILVRTVTPSY